MARTLAWFTAIAVVCLAFADIDITTVDPWAEFGRLALGLVTPDFTATENLLHAIAMTLAFALLGVSLSVVLGFALALVFHIALVRGFCAVVRAVHELFWALIFLQVFGLSPLTGILAIAIPYAGIVAKVFAEILEEADDRALRTLPPGTGRLSALLFVRLPDVWAHYKTYALYRLECGLRSSAVLGFVGLPTLGFHLETAFRQGNYAEAAALLYIFYVIIATQRLWARRQLLPLYLVAAAAILPWSSAISGANIARFFTADIVPFPLRNGEGLAGLLEWLHNLLIQQALPGTIATVQLTMIALLATGLLSALFFPLVSPVMFGRAGRTAGHVALVVIRSTPEYILAFVLLQLWGPSMLPAIVALALHNGGIIGHLVGRYTETLTLRDDAPRGLARYGYELLPRVYNGLLALLFYRWEIIMRETAILGILGIATLGFYVDSAFAELRFDRALVLIAITALLNIAIDMTSRRVRRHLRLRTTLEGR
ncbi:MAG: ABC transporter permease [Alphaproteobacteria bacterium]|nr:ABC transporter permease [Alphaproteobacteria bacterium]